MLLSGKLKLFFTIWFFVLLVNQIFIFHACFAPYCVVAALPHTGVIAFLLTRVFGHKVNSGIFGDFLNDIEKVAEQARKHIEANEKGLEYPSKEAASAGKSSNFRRKPEQNHLKKKGDRYERFVGNQLEEKGELVIYNGFIRDYEDGGVDVASISPEKRTVNLIQCKNWENRTLTLRDVQTIYRKLQAHPFDFLDLSAEQIRSQQTRKFDIGRIRKIMSDARGGLKHHTVRKTLYISSDKVVDLEVGKHLAMIKPNIYRYEDMKIVVVKDSK